MRVLDKIIIHSSNTPRTRKFRLKDLDIRDRKAGKFGVGVHFFIDREGYIETGRDITKVGVHAGKRNVGSIAIMLEGGVNEKNISQNNFTLHQLASLGELIWDLQQKYGITRIEGHHKSCPPFNVQEWVSETL